MVAGHVGASPRADDHFAFALPVPPRLGLGPRLQQRRGLGASPTGSAGFGRFRQRVRRVLGRRHLVAPPGRPASRSASRPSSPTAPSAAGARSTLEAARGRRRRARSSSAKRERVQPRAPPGQGRPRLAPGPLGARRHGHRPGLQASGATASRSSTPRVAGVASAPILSATTQDGPRRRRTTRPWSVAGGRDLALRRDRRPHHGRVVLVRRPVRHPGARSRRPSRAARRRSPSPSGARPRASSTSASASSSAWATGSCSTAAWRATSRPTFPSGTRSPRGTSPT